MFPSQTSVPQSGFCFLEKKKDVRLSWLFLVWSVCLILAAVSHCYPWARAWSLQSDGVGAKIENSGPEGSIS